MLAHRSPTNFMRWQDKSVQFESGPLLAGISKLQIANATQPDFLLTAHRDMAVARRFLQKAMRDNGAPHKFARDKSGANKAALDEINSTAAAPIAVRQIKYLNNIVEQDHRDQTCDEADAGV